MKRIFIAYPSEPSEVGQTIERAKEDAEKYGPNLEINTWRRDDLGGQPLITPIIESIEISDVVVGDISRLNFNVTYELGYAIGLGKRVLPLINGSLQVDEQFLARVGIYDSMIYQTYSTVNGLLEQVTVAEAGRRFATRYPLDPQPLYTVLPPVMTDDAQQLLTRGLRAGLRTRKFDPIEDGRLSAQDAVRGVATSNGVVLMLLSAEMKDAIIHNMRIAFVAGLAHALDKETLILHRGNWPTPLDIRDEVAGFTTDTQLGTLYSDFAARVHEARYASQLPAAGPENKLANVNLGDPAAEREETTLENYFLERDESRQVLDGRANIVVGRKGSGKSAIFIHVRDRLGASKANIILGLSPEAYQLRKLKDVVLGCLNAGSKEFLLSAFWEYVLLLEICSKIIDRDRDLHKRDHKLFEPYQQLLAYYRAETSSAGVSFSDRLLRLIDRIANRYSFTFGTRQNVDLSDGEVTNLLYETTLGKLRTELAQYARNKGKVFLLFDNIDKAWNANGLDNSDVIMIRTLLDANRKIGNDFRRIGTDFYSAVFLRNDVYDILLSQTPDRGKDSIALVDWSQPPLLRQMVRRRLLFNSTNKSLSLEHLWHNIAVPVIEGQDTLQFLISHSMMRPRYLLRLINYCKGNAINFGRDRVDESDIEAGLSQYSTDVVTEIGLEIRDVLPVGEDILYVFLGEAREMKRSNIQKLLHEKISNDDDMQAIFALLLWHGVLGLRRSVDDVTYIYDANYNIKRLLGLMEKATDHDPVIQINPAVWAGLELA
jgi:hypothetical protein